MSFDYEEIATMITKRPTNGGEWDDDYCRKKFKDKSKEEVIELLKSNCFCYCPNCSSNFRSYYRGVFEKIIGCCDECTLSLTYEYICEYNFNNICKCYSTDKIESILSELCEDDEFHYPNSIKLCQKCKLALFIWFQKKKSDNNDELEIENEILCDRVKQLELEIESLKNQIKYQPGGEVYQEAKREFEELANK